MNKSPVECIAQRGAAIDSGPCHLGHTVVQVRCAALVCRVVGEGAILEVIVITVVLQQHTLLTEVCKSRIWRLSG